MTPIALHLVLVISMFKVHTYDEIQAGEKKVYMKRQNILKIILRQVCLKNVMCRFSWTIMYRQGAKMICSVYRLTILPYHGIDTLSISIVKRITMLKQQY